MTKYKDFAPMRTSQELDRGVWKILNYNPRCELVPKDSLENWHCKSNKLKKAHTFVVDCNGKKIHTYPTMPINWQTGVIQHESIGMLAGIIDAEGEGKENSGGFLRVRIIPTRKTKVPSVDEHPIVDNYSITKEKRHDVLRCINRLGMDGLVPQDATIEAMTAEGVTMPQTTRVRHLKTLLRED